MRSDFIENIFVFTIMILIMVVIYHFGYGMSEKKHCNAVGGHYSFDYGECFKGEILK